MVYLDRILERRLEAIAVPPPRGIRFHPVRFRIDHPRDYGLS